MKADYTEEERYIVAKKEVQKLKGFYIHLFWYVVVNVFISVIIIYGLMTEDRHSFTDAIQNYGVYSTWFFWGIGVFFHWFGVIGRNQIGVGKAWETRKIEELMAEEKEKERKFREHNG